MGPDPAGRRALVLAGLLLAALNLRPAFASISPVLEAIRHDLNLSRAATGFLTMLPVLCMGFFAFFAARIGDRLGPEAGVLWALVLIGTSMAGRLAGDVVLLLYASAFLVGVGQELLPAAVKRYFAGLAAIAFVPLASPWVFAALIGFGIGGLFPLALTLPLDYAPDPASASRLTAMTLGVGYLLAATGHLAIGALRDAAGSYVTPLSALTALTTAMLASTPCSDLRRLDTPRGTA